MNPGPSRNEEPWVVGSFDKNCSQCGKEFHTALKQRNLCGTCIDKKLKRL